VSTPIGNLEDITFRAIKTLEKVSLIAAEDTRKSQILLNHYKIKTKSISYFEHNKLNRLPKLINHLSNGNDLALITDAGTPGISDPAYRIVNAAIEEAISVEPIPGPSAILASLVSSGLPTDRFIFEGFLPHKKGRVKKILNIKNQKATIIYYESPYRLLKTLKQLLDLLGDRPAAVSRELTKIHEQIKRGTLSSLVDYYNDKKVKGECVILIGKETNFGK
tara:strand:+ start:6199 stop:6861 length:663 start_codon:yes stop_codon:yes gene_type:complete